jgi:HK97 family phage prohead protease
MSTIETLPDWWLGPSKPSWHLDIRETRERQIQHRDAAATLEPKLRSADSGRPLMFGHFAVFDTWTEINNTLEGHFFESIAPGAFAETMRDDRQRIRVLFQHGQDPQVGNKVLGKIEELREDSTGAFYEVELLDAPYVSEHVLPGLRVGGYGSSFRFKVDKHLVRKRPPRSAENPSGLPETTLTKVKVQEFGPVTFPAYGAATAGVRAMDGQVVTTAVHAIAYTLDEDECWRERQVAPGLVERVRVHKDDAVSPESESRSDDPEPWWFLRGTSTDWWLD